MHQNTYDVTAVARRLSDRISRLYPNHSQDALAKLAGIKRGTLVNILQAGTADMQVGNLWPVCRLAKISLDEAVTGAVAPPDEALLRATVESVMKAAATLGTTDPYELSAAMLRVYKMKAQTLTEEVEERIAV